MILQYAVESLNSSKPCIFYNSYDSFHLMQAQEVSFDQFLAFRSQVVAALRDTSALWDQLDPLGDLPREHRGTKLRRLAEQTMEDSFHLMVVGEFKRGKSTLVNALLGDAILPAKTAPCTAVITEVRYGDPPSAVLYFKDQACPPKQLSLDEIRSYITIDHKDAAASEDDDSADAELAQIRQSPYERLEVRAPLALCKNGVAIVDSPGLNENQARTRIAMEYLERADAMVMVLSCEQALSQSEQQFIQSSLGKDRLENVFFVWNRWDAVRDSDEDREDLANLSNRLLKPRVGSAERIFYVSARDALNGRRKQNPGLLDQSCLPQFEGALERFLISERGKLKLLKPVSLLEQAIADGLRTIPERIQMLLMPLAELEQRYDAQKPNLDSMERRLDRILSSINNSGAALCLKVRDSYLQFITATEPKLREVGQTVDIGLWEATTTDEKNLHEKISAPLDKVFRSAMEHWKEQELKPLIAAAVALLEKEVKEDVSDFAERLSAIRNAILPNANINVTDVKMDADDKSSSGNNWGGLGPSIARAFSSTDPATVVFVLVVGLFGLLIGGIFEARSRARKFRDALLESYIAQVHKTAPQFTEAIEKHLQGNYAAIGEGIRSDLSLLIDELRGQVEAILEERRSRQKDIELHLKDLQEIQEQLQQAASRLIHVRAYVSRVRNVEV